MPFIPVQSTGHSGNLRKYRCPELLLGLSYEDAPVLKWIRRVDFHSTIILPQLFCGIKIDTMLYLVCATLVFVPLEFHDVILLYLYKKATYFVYMSKKQGFRRSEFRC